MVVIDNYNYETNSNVEVGNDNPNFGPKVCISTVGNVLGSETVQNCVGHLPAQLALDDVVQDIVLHNS